MTDRSKIARRSARPFIDDNPIAQAESASDAGASHWKGVIERGGRTHEMVKHSRNSSCSSVSGGEFTVELRGLHAPGETTGEVSHDLEAATIARYRVDGRPVNFGQVIPGVYRSGFPETSDHDYIRKLGLKTIVTLVKKEFPQGYESFIAMSGIRHVVIDMQGTKKVPIPHKIMTEIMETILDQSNYPLLVHCNHGKHRTGCAVAVMRLVQGWHVDMVVQEYCRYADTKVREIDINYIREFDVASLNQLSTSQRFETDSRAAGDTENSIGANNFRMGRILVITAIVLLLWFYTLSSLRN